MYIVLDFPRRNLWNSFLGGNERWPPADSLNAKPDGAKSAFPSFWARR